MGKKPTLKDDVLWQMLARELGAPEVRELQGYLDGEEEHYEMGYGDLLIEPYDVRGGSSRMFRIRHTDFGETIVSRAVLLSLLHDLGHELIKQGGMRR